MKYIVAIKSKELIFLGKYPITSDDVEEAHRFDDWSSAVTGLLRFITSGLLVPEWEGEELEVSINVEEEWL